MAKKTQAIHLEWTSISVNKTYSEIMDELIKIKTKGIYSEFDDDGNIIGMGFQVEVNGRLTPFKMPVDHKPLLEFARKNNTRNKIDEAQARRTVWRQLLGWVKSQVAMIQTGTFKTEQVFLHCMMVNQEQTVYDRAVEQGEFGKYLPPKTN
jgi:hypothetical protein